MASYITENNQDCFSVVNKTIGDLNQMYTFLLNNPTFKIDFVPIYATATYDKSNTTPLPVVSNKPSDPVTNKTFTSQQNQTIFDICLMTLTDLNQIYSFKVNLNDKPVANSSFNYNPQNITDNILSRAVLTFNTGERHTPADTNTYYLLLENGFYVLQENLGRIILE